MGAYGSGRKPEKDCTDVYGSISISNWRRDGLLIPGQQFNWQWLCNGERVGNVHITVEPEQIRLSYLSQNKNKEWQQYNYPVKLQTTLCPYGGVRYWMTCPTVGCERRIGLLYFGHLHFACRLCYQLNYRSQRGTFADRAFKGVNKIRKKLDWQPGLALSRGSKPNLMSWGTYDRLIAEHDACTKQAMLAISAKLAAKQNGL